MKKCKQCGKPRNHNNSLISLCKECQYKKSYNSTKQRRIKQVSTKNKNTPARFTSKTKAEILIRDKSCILCSSPIQDYHHIYYGGQAEYGEDRNNSDKGVGLCRTCHEKIHHFSDGESQTLRKKCIEYIKSLYG